MFDRINLKIQSGEKIAVIGPSGHGKSSLLKLIAGLLSPNSGDIRTDPELQSSVGMLFQQNALFDSMTVGQNLSFFMQEKASYGNLKEINSRVEALLKSVGLSHAKELFPSELSGGMKKRVGFARAIALKPKLLIFDDPTAGLDPILSSAIIELLNSNINQTNTAIMATSDMKAAFEFSKRMLCILNKEIIDFTIDQVPKPVENFILGR